ncbi:MAG TPA: acyltransferase family protein [Acidobacteriaceae bacterium]
MGSSELTYRPHIDGLRAIAVLLVLFDHLELPFMRGGFVGVDIFFVISGYLITGNIDRLIGAGKFTLFGFYERRFRRIFPALFVMLGIVSIFAYLVFLPLQLVEYSRLLLAAVFSYSNLHLYWTDAGYFGLNYAKILLHTWSLGVEEQFYLFIPLAMLLVANRPRILRWMVGLGAVLSLLLATYFALHKPDLAFYMPYTRAWELLAGALISLGMVRCPQSRNIREVMVAAGLVVIVVYAMFFKATLPFPGVSAIPPCLAAMLIIMAGGETAAGAVLRWRPTVFIGLVSYSLYLWHWPVITMARLGAVHGVKPGTITGAFAIVLLSIALAYLSWRFVEQPFRAGRFRTLPQSRIFLYAGVGAVAIAALAFLLGAEDGRPQRFSKEALQVGASMQVLPQMRTGSCFVETGFQDFDKAGCLQKMEGKPNVLLFGDSHAAALWWGLQHGFPGIHFLQATLAACPPTEGHYARSNCSQMRRFMYESYLPINRVDAVILTERWTSSDDLKAMESALSFFQSRGTPVVVVGPVPEYTAPLPFLLALGLKWHDPELPGRNRVAHLETVDRQLRAELSGRPGITYASIWDALCTNESCMEYAGGSYEVPVLADVDHLSNQGSLDVVNRMKSAGELPLR